MALVCPEGQDLGPAAVPEVLRVHSYGMARDGPTADEVRILLGTGVYAMNLMAAAFVCVVVVIAVVLRDAFKEPR